MSADISPVVAAVEQAEREHQWTHGWGCTCGNSGNDPEHIRAEVAKAAMDAARPIILREAAERFVTEYTDYPSRRVLREWADELTDTDDRSESDE